MKRLAYITSDSTKAYHEMYELFLQNKFTEATRKGAMILKKTPHHEKTLLLLGQIALQRKQRQKAREMYNKILQDTHNDTTARIGRADASYGKKEYESALQDYLYLYETSRKTFTYRAKLAMCYSALGLDHLALDYYKKAVALQPSDMQTRFALIKHLLKLRHYKEAASELQLTKDRYYHHKSSYHPSVFDEITHLDHLVGRYYRKK